LQRKKQRVRVNLTDDANRAKVPVHVQQHPIGTGNAVMRESVQVHPDLNHTQGGEATKEELRFHCGIWCTFSTCKVASRDT
jgi:hypothetical protein